MIQSVLSKSIQKCDGGSTIHSWSSHDQKQNDVEGT